MSERIYPLLFMPVYKDYIWGGSKIAATFKRTSCPPVCAESWEISDRTEGMSVVSNGMLSGATLRQVIETMPDEILGSGRKSSRFPLLLKIIDARERLSLQVHPDDEKAAILSAEAKSEMWYILSAEPGAKIFAGFRQQTTPALFQSALASKRIEELLKPVPVESGDAIYIPGGTMHAISEGCLIMEVQQNSNTTYRAYDWNRVDKNGVPRELHTAEAIKATNWDRDDTQVIRARPQEKHQTNSIHGIISCPYFRTSRLRLSTHETIKNNGAGFHALFVAGGSVVIRTADHSQKAEHGASLLMPAAIPEYEIQPTGGKADILHVCSGS